MRISAVGNNWYCFGIISGSGVAVVLVAEPAPMETGKVVINTDQLPRGLADEGKIALYGICFDTGAAPIKPESKPQLDEMARPLTLSKALKVFAVGHSPLGLISRYKPSPSAALQAADNRNG